MDAAVTNVALKSGTFDFETMSPGLVPSLNLHAAFSASAQTFKRILTKLDKVASAGTMNFFTHSTFCKGVIEAGDLPLIPVYADSDL
jgi:hypothetical protein